MGYIEYRKHKILRYLDSLKNGWRKFPPSLQVSLTDYCFNKCIMCGHWKRKNKSSLDLTRLIEFLTYGQDHGLETVCYSGGDPFLYGEDLNILMRWHIDNNVKFGFITAGYVPWGQIDFGLLPKAEWVRCSLDAVDPDVYRASRGGISCDKVVESIEMMVANNVNVCFGITIHRKNETNIKDIFDFAISLNIHEVRAWIVRNVDGLEPENKALLASMLSLYRQLFKMTNIDNNLVDTLNILESKREQLPFDRCYACLFQLFIDANGDVYPCCIIAGDTESSANHSPLGNIHNDSWRVIKSWIDNFSALSFKELPAICRRNCILRLSTINHFANKYWEEQNFI